MCKSFDEGYIFCLFKPENGTKRFSKVKGSNSTCFQIIRFLAGNVKNACQWEVFLDRIVKVSILYSIVYFLATHPCGRVAYSYVNTLTP